MAEMPDVTVQPVPPAAEPLATPDPPPRGPRWRPSRLQLAGIGGAALAGAAAVAGLLVLTSPARVKVPSVSRLDYSTATRLVRQAGFDPRVEPVTSEQPGGQIVSQSPRPDRRADKGSTVVLRMSMGPTLVIVPDLLRQSPAAVTRALQAIGLGTTRARAPSSSVPRGQVAATEPAASMQASRGSKVIVTVSTGPERVKVPDLAGLRQADAQQRLATAGLRVVIVLQESSSPAGQVVSQDPKAGQRTRKGATGRIVVAAAAPSVIVPSVTGMDLTSGVAAMSGAGLRIQLVDRKVKSGTNGTVLDQSLPAQSHHPRGTTISLTIARR
jgi:beta-lactam-binding protein with PASTA domain